MPTRVTQASQDGVTQHQIDLRGLAGAMMCVSAVANVVIIVAFATTGWTVFQNDKGQKIQIGLWETCGCSTQTSSASWFKATQAMITIGMIVSLLALVLVFVYNCIHFISKTLTLIIFMALSFVSVGFMLIGVIIFGARGRELVPASPSYSYAFAVIGTGLSLTAGILALMQRSRSQRTPTPT